MRMKLLGCAATLMLLEISTVPHTAFSAASTAKPKGNISYVTKLPAGGTLEFKYISFDERSDKWHWWNFNGARLSTPPKDVQNVTHTSYQEMPHLMGVIAEIKNEPDDIDLDSASKNAFNFNLSHVLPSPYIPAGFIVSYLPSHDFELLKLRVADMPWRTVAHVGPVGSIQPATQKYKIKIVPTPVSKTNASVKVICQRNQGISRLTIDTYSGKKPNGQVITTFDKGLLETTTYTLYGIVPNDIKAVQYQLRPYQVIRAKIPTSPSGLPHVKTLQ